VHTARCCRRSAAGSRSTQPPWRGSRRGPAWPSTTLERRTSIDGHPLRLLPYAGVMLQARVPPGRHTIVLTYWPLVVGMRILKSDDQVCLPIDASGSAI